LLSLICLTFDRSPLELVADQSSRGVGTQGLDEKTALKGYTLIAPLTSKNVSDASLSRNAAPR
jgi:hypothetical protein